MRIIFTACFFVVLFLFYSILSFGQVLSIEGLGKIKPKKAVSIAGGNSFNFAVTDPIDYFNLGNKEFYLFELNSNGEVLWDSLAQIDQYLGERYGSNASVIWLNYLSLNLHYLKPMSRFDKETRLSFVFSPQRNWIYVSGKDSLSSRSIGFKHKRCVSYVTFEQFFKLPFKWGGLYGGYGLLLGYAYENRLSFYNPNLGEYQRIELKTSSILAGAYIPLKAELNIGSSFSLYLQKPFFCYSLLYAPAVGGGASSNSNKGVLLGVKYNLK